MKIKVNHLTENVKIISLLNMFSLIIGLYERHSFRALNKKKNTISNFHYNMLIIYIVNFS